MTLACSNARHESVIKVAKMASLVVFFSNRYFANALFEQVHAQANGLQKLEVAFFVERNFCPSNKFVGAVKKFLLKTTKAFGRWTGNVVFSRRLDFVVDNDVVVATPLKSGERKKPFTTF